MHLDAHGHPLHSRALSITLSQRDAGRLDVAGSLLDLRKRGFVPVGGELQPSGIVHHMLLDGIVDPTGPTLATLAARQPAVAFESSALTKGESCRDLAGRVGGLAGTRLDDRFARRLSEEIGGPRGCSHVLTLAQLLGTTVAWALDRDRALVGDRPVRPAGQRIFRRDIVVDGIEALDGTLLLALQLTDVHHAPTPEPCRPMDRFAGCLEVRALATVDMGNFALDGIRIGERRRWGQDLDAAWREREDVATAVAALPLGRGVSATLLSLLGGSRDDQPVLDALLQLAPTLIQVFAALSDQWPALARSSGWTVGMGGRADSCWMWRRGGALEAAKTPEDPRFGY
jgi:hypothetical protein